MCCGHWDKEKEAEDSTLLKDHMKQLRADPLVAMTSHSHMGIYGNEMANQLDRQDSSCQLIGSKPVFGISAKVSREMLTGLIKNKHKH
jgi:hypothetical protein